VSSEVASGSLSCKPSSTPQEKQANAHAAKRKKLIDISATGLGLLRTLHSQIMPFILRRTKDVCLPDLPAKSIVEVYCPLSQWQQFLYGEVQRGLVQLSDEALAKQLETYYFSKTRPRISKGSIAKTVATNGQDLDLSDCTAARDTLHPLNALIALKRVCVYPRSLSAEKSNASSGVEGVIDQAIDKFNKELITYNRLLRVSQEEHGVRQSGKLCQLANVLVESGIASGGAVVSTGVSVRNMTDESDVDIGVVDYPWTVRGGEPGVTENANDANDSDRDFDDDDDGYDGSDGYDTESDISGDRSEGSCNGEDTDEGDGTFGGSDSDDESSTCSANKEDSTKELRNKKKCLIFAEHLHTLDVIETFVLRDLFPSLCYCRLDGRVTAMQRALVADSFNRGIANDATSEVPQILLLTTGACGLGLNLNSVEVVIFVEHSWNPFIDLQAMDRVHRIGTSKPVTVYRLIAESTIETRIQALQLQKQMLADEVIQGEGVEVEVEDIKTGPKPSSEIEL